MGPVWRSDPSGAGPASRACGRTAHRWAPQQPDQGPLRVGARRAAMFRLLESNSRMLSGNALGWMGARPPEKG